MTRNCWIWILLGSAACGFEDDSTTASTEQALYGAEGDYEFAIDAPWRIEPTMPGLDYDAIPITITINDAYFKVDNALEYSGPAVWQAGLGRVKALTVTEHGAGTFDIPLADFHEVERVIGPWHVSGGPDPQHQLCRQWAGEDCAGSDMMVLTETSEWHATVFYKPHGLQTPGRDVRLDFALTVSQVNRAQTPVPYPLDKPDHVFENQVSVHLGEAPLPRFDDTTWAYGDLHYHSQGTDNEGESGYAYRSVIHGMAAIGLDFALASEHASDSEQMNDFDIDAGSPFQGTEFFDADLLRDMNDARYGHLWHWLQDLGGANRTVTAQRRATASRLRVPQIFLGGEVDVVPEMPAGDEASATSYLIDYGNNLHYDILSACDRQPDVPFVFANCDRQSVKQDTGDGRWIVRDPQSTIMAAARQHMLYLPHFATGDSGFISSSTTKYGGGRFRLRDLVHANFELNDQGDFFLAHPLDAPSTTAGFGSLGPDIVPYSQAQYDDIFGSQHFRGLQLWNSDSRREIDASFGINHLRPWNGANSTWETAPSEPGIFKELHHGAATWDRLLLAGMDPGRTSGIAWLAPGEPRKLFMAGGSDAHGDLNFRRPGYMVIAPLNEDIDSINDTAMGTPRNLVHAGAPQGNPLADGIESRPFTQDQVFAAMARGEFAVTDGPALRLLWDTNRNGAIDDTDVPMGGAIAFDPQAGVPPLIVDWKSTAEFGDLDRIDLYVGAASGARGVVYAPAQHGVRQSAPLGMPSTVYRDETTGRSITSLDDGYWQGDLRVPIPFGQEQVGHTVVQLRMSDFRVGTKGSRVCVVNAGSPKRDCFMRFGNPVDPEHIYVRAFARTTGALSGGGACADSELARRDGKCIPRLAFTNPVWARPAHPMRASTIVAANGRCLDVLGGATQNGAPIGVWSCNGSPMQQWSYDMGGKTLVGLANKLLDALGWQSFEGAPVGLWDRDGAWNQQWTLRGVEIRGIQGKQLSIDGSWEGSSAVLATTTAQRWTLTAAGELRSADNRCLDVYGHWTHDGAPVMAYNCYGTTNQQWRVLAGGMLQGTESGKCLASPSDSPGDGTQLVLAPCTGAPAQRWSMRGEIRAWNDMCLDVYGGASGDGAPVMLYTCHGGPNQQFTVYP